MNRQFAQIPGLLPESMLTSTNITPETSPVTDRPPLSYMQFSQFAPTAYSTTTPYQPTPILSTTSTTSTQQSLYPASSIIPSQNMYPSMPPSTASSTNGSVTGHNGSGNMGMGALRMDMTPNSSATRLDLAHGGAHETGDPSSSASSPYGGNGNGNASGDGGGAMTVSPGGKEERKRYHKQKRNKPTLSCAECVERKTKCDRGRPTCFACVKRESVCVYDRVAQLLEESHRTSCNGPRMVRPQLKRRSTTKSSMVPNIADRGVLNSMTSQGAVALSTGLMSSNSLSSSSGSNVFGVGARHPFANYWTCEGGLPEVISVLPAKSQTDSLMARYFECVDPVYPMIHRQTFYADYEAFWSMTDRSNVDASFVALMFVMIALGAQFVDDYPNPERRNMAEFYASASNQALRVFSYLSTASITSIQAMVLITYFLINDNHVSDGWSFAGILTRQAYAMGLHRDPNIVTPGATLLEKQQRRKLWQAVILQDTFLTILLSLPPSATHTDVSVDSLADDDSSIANSSPVDIWYIKCSWNLANLVQESICSPRALDLPICTTQRHKTKLINEFKSVYRSFPDIFRCWDKASLTARAPTEGRAVRQTLWLTSNFFHNMMLVNASISEEVSLNMRGTLEAAHDALAAFFLLYELFESEARQWWAFNHRAFLEAVCIGATLKYVVEEDMMIDDTLYARAREDLKNIMKILRAMAARGSELARTRVNILQEYLQGLE